MLETMESHSPAFCMEKQPARLEECVSCNILCNLLRLFYKSGCSSFKTQSNSSDIHSMDGLLNCCFQRLLFGCSRSKLPLPSLNGVRTVSKDKHEDNPELHNGRLRQFSHVRGNWPTFVYLQCMYVPFRPSSFAYLNNNNIYFI